MKKLLAMVISTLFTASVCGAAEITPCEKASACQGVLLVAAKVIMKSDPQLFNIAMSNAERVQNATDWCVQNKKITRTDASNQMNNMLDYLRNNPQKARDLTKECTDFSIQIMSK